MLNIRRSYQKVYVNDLYCQSCLRSHSLSDAIARKTFNELLLSFLFQVVDFVKIFGCIMSATRILFVPASVERTFELLVGPQLLDKALRWTPFPLIPMAIGAGIVTT